MKKLIVTADDVGLDRGMTAGAIEAHRNGIVTACSIVANGREFEDAVSRLRDCPRLEAGVHLTLVEERRSGGPVETMSDRERDVTRFLSELHRRIEETQSLEDELRTKLAALEKREKEIAHEWERRESARFCGVLGLRGWAILPRPRKA